MAFRFYFRSIDGYHIMDCSLPSSGRNRTWEGSAVPNAVDLVLSRTGKRVGCCFYSKEET